MPADVLRQLAQQATQRQTESALATQQIVQIQSIQQAQTEQEAKEAAAKEMRKADLPGYGHGYTTKVQKQLDTKLQSLKQATPTISTVAPSTTNYIALSTGEYVAKVDFDKLSADDQVKLKQMGVKGFNDYYQQQQIVFTTNNIQLKTGEYIPKADYDKLDKTSQDLLMNQGIKAFNDYQTQQLATFKANNVQLSTGEYVPAADYNKLSTDWQRELSARGTTDFNTWVKTAYPGSTGLVQATNPDGTTTIYGATSDPTIGLDSNGNRIFIGDRWPDSVKKAMSRTSVYPGAWPTEVTTFKTVTAIPTYTGTATAIGGTWGKTPETLAVQQISTQAGLAGVISNQSQQQLQNSIASLQGTSLARYNAALQNIQSQQGTAAQKLASYSQQLQSQFQQAIAQRTVPIITDKQGNELVMLGTGEYMFASDFKDLSIVLQSQALTSGLKSIYVTTTKGEQILKEWVDQNLDKVHIDKLMKEGIKGLQDLFNAEETTFNMDNIKLKTGEFINRLDFSKLPEGMQKAVTESGIKAIDTSNLTPEQTFNKMKEWGVISKESEFGGIDKTTGDILLKDGTPLYERILTADFAKGAAIGMIPVAGTVYFWNEMQPWERGISIALDIATIIPFVGAISAGVRAGKGVGTALGRAVLTEIKAPLTAIAHPLETLKSTAMPLETLLRGKKIPLTALEIRTNAVRIPVEDIGKATDAMQARDILVSKAIKGERPTIEIAGKQIELAKVALNQKTIPAVVHATPDIRPFLEGTIIQEGREGGLFMSPSLHTRFTGASAFGDLPEGGIAGAIIIRDENILSKLQPSGKIYRSSAEIEKVLPAGVKLPPPSQVLVTRDASNRLLTLAVIGQPLSASEIAKMKFIGSADVINDIFRPAFTISGKATKYDELLDIGREARQLEKDLAKAKTANKVDEATKIEQEIRALDNEARVRARALDIEYASRTSLRPIGLALGDYIDRISFNELARTNPKELAYTLSTAPKTERTRIINDIDTRYRADIRTEIDRIISGKERVSPEITSRVEVPTSRTIVSSLTRTAPKTIERIPERVISRTTERVVTRVPERITLRVVERVPIRVPERSITRVPERPGERIPPRIPTTRIPPTIPPTTPPGKPPVKPPTAKASFADLTLAQKEASIAWKQGWAYHLIYPPWSANNVLHSKEPFPGVKIHTGIGSASKSLAQVKGESLPDKILWDLGIVDITFKKGYKGKVGMTYKSDVGDKSKVRKPIGVPTATKIKRVAVTPSISGVG